MMKTLMLCILVMVITATCGWAQNADVNIKQVVQYDGNSTPISQDDLINAFADISSISGLQLMEKNVAQLAKTQLRGDGNSAHIAQNGNNNTGIINIDGNGNRTNLNQSGNDLLSLIAIMGSQNNLDVTQIGNQLGNLIQVKGANGINVDVDQNDSGLRYRQGGGNSMPMQIMSSDRNVPIIITNH